MREGLCRKKAGPGSRAFHAVVSAAALSLSCAAGAEEGLLFPRLERTARGAALGEGAAHLEGIHAVGVNAAGLASSPGELLMQRDRLPGDAALARVGVSRPVGSGAAAVSYMDLTSARMDRRDAMGRSQGSAKSQDQMAAFSLARRVGRFPVLGGLSVKYMRFDTGGLSAETAALDLGLRAAASGAVSFGATLSNWGKGAVFAEKESRLPTAAGLGAAWKPSASLSLLADHVHGLRAGDGGRSSLGMEWSPGSAFSLRGGYAAASGADSSFARQDVAAGFGLRLRGCAVDYAFQTSPGAGASEEPALHRMTLTFELPGAKKAPARRNP